MNSVHLIVSMSSFVAVTCLVLLAGRQFFSRDLRIDDRFANLRGRGTGSPTPDRGVSRFWGHRAEGNPSGRRSAIQLMQNLQGEEGELQARLLHAGIYSPWALSTLLTAKTLGVVIPLAIGVLADSTGWTDNPRGLCLGAAASCLGVVLPGIWLGRMKRNRHSLFARTLPDFLDLLVTCLEAGMSIEAALQRVSDEVQLAHPTLGGEMKAVQTQIELGATPETALRHLAERTDYDPLGSLSTVVQQARRFGSGVAEALRQHANGLRTQREQVAEEKAQKASVQILLPTMLLIFPAIFVVLAGPAAIKLSESFSSKADSKPAPVTRSAMGARR
ncbi:MAG: type II secretion system F family protein [Planctomycetaceae bacterium]|nr:type II secretion system F family protein [Planctomycetaceae bacterium]